MTVGKYMTYLFVSENVGVIMDSVEIYLWCIGICFIPLAVVNIYRNGIQGLGYGLLPMMAGVAELVGRGAVAVAAAKQRSYTGPVWPVRQHGSLRDRCCWSCITIS